MPGKLLAVGADLTRLVCDAWLLPTDVFGTLEPSWTKHVARTPRLRDETLARLRAGDAATPTEWPGSRPPVLLPIGRGSTDDPSVFVDAAVEALGTLSKRLTGAPGPVTRRAVPLVAMPVIGIGQSGGRAVAGAVVRQMVDRVERFLEEQPGRLDVVLVAYLPESFAALQQVRRSRLSAAAAGSTMERLARSAAEGAMVAFVGAGVSASAGLPTWSELLDLLTSDAKIEEPLRSRLAKAHHLDRARLLKTRLEERGEKSLGDAVAGHTDRSEYGLMHAQLACLPVHEMTTTNYDRLLEMACDDARAPVRVLPYQRLHARERWLLKLHGSVDHRDDIVLTREDYLDYDGRRGALRGIVQALLITRHMLFVGFGLEDDNFLRIAHEVRTAVKAVDATADRRFGTVLTLLADPVREELWHGDLHVHAFADESRGEAAFHEAAREQELFLDELLLRTGSSVRHLLQERFDGALNDDEREAKQLLGAIVESARRRTGQSPTWERLRQVLTDFGAEGRRRETASTTVPHMEIVNREGDPIRSVEDWHRLAPPAGKHGWAEGASAASLARAWMEAPVAEELTRLLRLNPDLAALRLERGTAEKRTAFDDVARGPRNHDLLIVGQGATGPVVIGVEAKVNEPFGETIAEYAAKERSPNSQALGRLHALTELCFGRSLADDGDLGSIRYQLLSATAGTLADAREQAAVGAVLLVHELVTPRLTAERSKQNDEDLLAFIERLGRGDGPLRRTESANGWVAGPTLLHSDSDRLPPSMRFYVAKLRTSLS